MSTVVVLGIPGESDLWLADFSAGTVSKMAPPESGPLADAVKLRSSGAVINKGVDFSLAVSSMSAVSSGPLDAWVA